MASNFRWFGDKVFDKLQKGEAQNLRRACIYLQGQVKQELNSGKSPPYSQPGEPPHRLQGGLLRSIAYEVENLVGRVGSNLKYSKYLEEGTTHMEARPYLQSTLDKNHDTIRKILTTPIK